MNEMFLQLKPGLQDFFDEQVEDVIWLNLHGDYTYMTEGYYLSLDAEISGKRVLPTTEEILDAYVVPLAMEKAGRNGIPIPASRIVNSYLGVNPPVALYPINQFLSGYQLALGQEELEPKFKKVTMSGRFAALVQELPNDYRIDTVRSVLGRCLVHEYQDFALRAFQVFHLPLMKVKVLVTPSTYYLSSIEPFSFDSLTLKEKALLKEAYHGKNSDIH